MADVYVKSFTHLKDRHRADDALKLLQRIASLVKPIMRKRGWILPTLAEFFPDNPNLLGEFGVSSASVVSGLRNTFDGLKHLSVLQVLVSIVSFGGFGGSISHAFRPFPRYKYGSEDPRQAPAALRPQRLPARE